MDRAPDPRTLLRLVLLELPGPTLDEEALALLRRYPVGGLVLFRKNLPSAEHAAELCRELHTHVPDPILAIDQEGGSVARLLDLPLCPGAMALGAAGDPELTCEVGAATARSLRTLGFNLNFAPVADVNLSARNPVIGPRAFGSSADRVSAHVRAFVRGHQAEGVAACVKHFPGHGDTHLDSHLDLPVLSHSLERLEAVELRPFRAAIEEGCAAVMSGHLLVEALERRPATVSSAVLQGLLRERLGFGGVAATDALNMGGIAQSLGPQAAAEALAAGSDLLLVLGSAEQQRAALEALLSAAASGRLRPGRVEEASLRVEALRRRYPSRPGQPAPRRSDHRLMEHAADLALTRIGRIEPLRPDETLLLVAPDPAEARPASLAAADAEPVALAVYRHLLAAWPRCSLFGYPALRPLEAAGAVLQAARRAERVLWLSCGRLRPADEERELAREVFRFAPSLVHLAVYNPYSVLDIPGPALLTYGFREPSLRALAAALRDPAACRGALPIELSLGPRA
jgi:beta-N-acetylhexosaminidase